MTGRLVQRNPMRSIIRIRHRPNIPNHLRVRTTVSGYLNFHQTFAEKHTVSAMLGAQYNLKEYDYTVVTAKDVQSSLEILNGSGDIFLKNSAKTSSPDKWQEAMMSYFGRFNYNYLSKSIGS